MQTIPTLNLTLAGIPALIVVSILIGGGLTVTLITQGVLTLEPWYEPKFVVPLAGMVFGASGMSAAVFLTLLRARAVSGELAKG